MLFETADGLLGDREAVLLVDDTALVKQGRHSVPVAWCDERGKRSNCQNLVTLTLAREEVPLPIWLRPFLPESWATDAERCQQARIPVANRVHRPKWLIALDGLGAARTSGVRLGSVGADAEYGKAREFRRARQQRDLLYAEGVLPQQRFHPADVVLHPPERKRPGVRPPGGGAALRAERANAGLHRGSGRRGASGGHLAQRDEGAAEGACCGDPGAHG